MHFAIDNQLAWIRSKRTLIAVDVWGQWQILVNALRGGWCQSSFAQMAPQALLCADVWGFPTTMGQEALWQSPFLQTVPKVCLVLPAYQRAWQRKMQSPSRHLLSHRVLLQTMSMNFLDEVPFFSKGQFIHFFPYWIYFASISHVYCKPGTKKHILLRQSGTNLKSSDIFIPFKLWEIYSNSFLERTVELSKSIFLCTISPSQLWYLKDTGLLLGFPFLSRSSAPCPLPSPSTSPAFQLGAFSKDFSWFVSWKLKLKNIFWAWQQMSAGARRR